MGLKPCLTCLIGLRVAHGQPIVHGTRFAKKNASKRCLACALGSGLGFVFPNALQLGVSIIGAHTVLP